MAFASEETDPLLHKEGIFATGGKRALYHGRPGFSSRNIVGRAFSFSGRRRGRNPPKAPSRGMQINVGGLMLGPLAELAGGLACAGAGLGLGLVSGTQTAWPSYMLTVDGWRSATTCHGHQSGSCARSGQSALTPAPRVCAAHRCRVGDMHRMSAPPARQVLTFRDRNRLGIGKGFPPGEVPF